MSDQPFDMNSLLQQAQAMSEQLMAAQQQAASQVHEGQSGGGAVRISMTGGFEFTSVTIAPEAVDPDDVEMLQDLVLAALHDVMSQAAEGQGGGLDLGGMDIGGLLGGLGGALGPGA